MLAVFKREFLSYFRSPVGYVALALFSFLSGYVFINQIGYGAVNMSSEIISLRSFFIIIVPIITMGLFAEDKRRGTEILFYTTPVSLINVVVGKFLAAFALFGVMFINVFVHMIITAFYGGVIDIGAWGSVIVFFFMAATFISIGVFASVITDNQIISAIVCFITILVIQLVSTISTLVATTVSSVLSSTILNVDTEKVSKVVDTVTNGINWLDPFTKTQDFRYGVFSVAPLVFCMSLAVIFIYLTFRVLEKKRWSQG